MQPGSLFKFVISIFLVSTFQAQADGQIGIDYFSGENFAPTVNDFTELPVDGVGFSLGLGLTENLNWSIYQNSQSGAQNGTERVGVLNLSTTNTIDSSSWGSGLSYFGENFWVGLRYSFTDDEIKLVGRPAVRENLEVDFLETQKIQSVGVEVGRDWLLGNWSPSVSLGLRTQQAELSRQERIGRINLTQIQLVDEDLSGTDVSLSASLLYYFELGNQATLAPSIGLFYQSQLSGEISGVSQLGLRTAEGSRRRSLSYNENISADSQTSMDAGINLLLGDWIINGTYITDLSSESTSDSVLLGISYSF